MIVIVVSTVTGCDVTYCATTLQGSNKHILIADIEELTKRYGCIRHISRRLNAKEVLITHKNGEFVFPVADGSATSSGRDNEFQEPTLRRESTVRRENLSGESHGVGEEFQLTRKLRKTSGLSKETLFTVIESSIISAERRVMP